MLDVATHIASLDEDDLGARIPAADMPEEIAPLVERLNDLLQRLEQAFVRESVVLEPLLHGGPHEAGRRTGMENALLIAGLETACKLAQQQVQDDRIGGLAEQFWRLLCEHLGERIVMNG